MKPKNMPGNKWLRRTRALGRLQKDHPDSEILKRLTDGGHSAALAIRSKKDRTDRARIARSV